MRFDEVKTQKLPTMGIQKEFSQAFVHILNGGEAEAVLSYDTIVASYDKDGFHRHWEGYSATSLRHINAFRLRHGMRKMGKQEWLATQIEKFEW